MLRVLLANHNVRLAMLFTVLNAVASSIALNQLNSLFVYGITGSDFLVGLSSGVQGGLQLLFSVPGGLLADMLRRDRVIRWSAGLGVLAVAGLCVAYVRESMAWVYVGLGAWGAFAGFVTGPLEASFADSVRSGSRSLLYSAKHALDQAGQAIGPAVSMVMFGVIGNSWSTGTLRPVLLVGMAFAAAAVGVLPFFNDDHALPEPASGTHDQHGSSPPGASVVAPVTEEPPGPAHDSAVDERAAPLGRAADADGSEQLLGGEGRAHDVAPTAMQPLYLELAPSSAGDAPPALLHSPVSTAVSPACAGAGDVSAALRTDRGLGVVRCCWTASVAHDRSTAAAAGSRKPPRGHRAKCIFCCCPRAPVDTYRLVASVLIATDLAVSWGAGMTVKFFPLFFAEELGLGPVVVSLVYFGSLVATVGLSAVTQLASRRIGRLQAIILMRALGVACLFGISVLRVPWLCAVVFVLRTGLSNSTAGLQKSILMDVVGKRSRGKVNSIEGIAQFSWTGSAVIGGMLVTARGYRYCFTVTATLYLAVLLPLLLIAHLVPDEEGTTPVRTSAAGTATTVEPSQSGTSIEALAGASVTPSSPQALVASIDPTVRMPPPAAMSP